MTTQTEVPVVNEREIPLSAGKDLARAHATTPDRGVAQVAFRGSVGASHNPRVESKSKDTRYLDIHEEDQLDESQLAAWVKQASQLRGERM